MDFFLDIFIRSKSAVLYESKRLDVQRDGKLNTLGYFGFFWVMVYWIWVQKPCIVQMPQILIARCNFTLRWFLDLENILEKNLRLKTLDYLLFIPAIFLFTVSLPLGKLLTIIKKTVSIARCSLLHLG